MQKQTQTIEADRVTLKVNDIEVVVAGALDATIKVDGQKLDHVTRLVLVCDWENAKLPRVKITRVCLPTAERTGAEAAEVAQRG